MVKGNIGYARFSRIGRFATLPFRQPWPCLRHVPTKWQARKSKTARPIGRRGKHRTKPFGLHPGSPLELRDGSQLHCIPSRLHPNGLPFVRMEYTIRLRIGMKRTLDYASSDPKNAYDTLKLYTSPARLNTRVDRRGEHSRHS